MVKKEAETKRVLVLPDLHVPDQDKMTLRAVERYMGDEHWDEVIQLGDFMDFSFISSHNKGKLLYNEKRRLQDDYDEGNRVLDRWQSLAKGAKFTILEGNHDFRAQSYIVEHPEAQGLLEVEKNLRLKERGIKWVKSHSKGDIHRIGKANFIHGFYVNEFHAKKHALTYGANIFYGHLHDFQQHSITTNGDNETRVAQSLGCLLNYRPLYLKGFANKWQQGFAVFHFFKNGFFQYFPVMIFGHKFISPEGKIYDGKKKD